MKLRGGLHLILNTLILAAVIWVAFTWGSFHWIGWANAHQLELLIGAVVVIILYRL